MVWMPRRVAPRPATLIITPRVSMSITCTARPPQRQEGHMPGRARAAPAGGWWLRCRSLAGRVGCQARCGGTHRLLLHFRHVSAIQVVLHPVGGPQVAEVPEGGQEAGQDAHQRQVEADLGATLQHRMRRSGGAVNHTPPPCETRLPCAAHRRVVARGAGRRRPASGASQPPPSSRAEQAAAHLGGERH
jgi:hypothetical protein